MNKVTINGKTFTGISSISVSTAKPAPRRQKRVQKPIIVEPKQPATMFELRIGRWSFILSFVSHTKGAK